MSRLVAALVAAVGLVFAGTVEFAAAQGSASLVHPGARVRVFVSDTTRAAAPSGEISRERDAPKSSRLIATLVEFRDDAIVVRRNAHGEPLTIPLEHVRRWEVSESRKSKSGSGALVGLIAGIGGGIGAAFIVCADGGCEEAEGSNDYTALVSAAFGLGGGLVGAGLGAVTGSFFHSEEWVAVPLPNSPLGRGSRPCGGLRLALAIHF